ncbi:MAG: nodulation protein NfeD [Armatimonadetes bacterium]|nr:nodulation protein NfeD [Armatimonadota bacterium]
MSEWGGTRFGRPLAMGALLVLGPAFLAAQRSAPAPGPVLVLTIDGDVNPVVVEYLRRGLREGQARKAELVVVRLDTPGGQLESTRDIARSFLAADVPIAVYVWPPGGRAGSAGTFITLGAHVAAMAPQTNIGAAHPILSGGAPGEQGPDGEQLKTLTEKATNDALALMRNLTARNGRNGEWAQRAITQSVSATAEEAVKLGAVDFTAADMSDLLAQADGRKVRVSSGERVLRTASAAVEFLPMNWREALLCRLANPNIAYILMMLGIYGLIIELKTPGFGGAGILGAICLILALYSLSVLPVNFAGLALIAIGIGFLIGELFSPTHGLLTAGGIAAFTVGSLILVDDPQLHISRPLIAAVAVSLIGFFVFALGAIVKGQRRRVVTGAQGMIGRLAEVRQPLQPEGTVFVDGALWTAESVETPVDVGEQVEILEVVGLRLRVRRAGTPTS